MRTKAEKVVCSAQPAGGGDHENRANLKDKKVPGETSRALKSTKDYGVEGIYGVSRELVQKAPGTTCTQAQVNAKGRWWRRGGAQR